MSTRDHVAIHLFPGGASSGRIPNSKQLSHLHTGLNIADIVAGVELKVAPVAELEVVPVVFRGVVFFVGICFFVGVFLGDLCGLVGDKGTSSIFSGRPASTQALYLIRMLGLNLVSRILIFIDWVYSSSLKPSDTIFD